MDILTEVDLRDHLSRVAMWSQRYQEPSKAYEEARERVEEALAVPDPKVEIDNHPQRDFLRAR